MILENYKFENIIYDLKIGREIEFTYEEKKYAITNASGFWFFICTTDNLSIPLCKFEDEDILVNSMSLIEISNIKLEQIFNELLYNQKSLYVL